MLLVAHLKEKSGSLKIHFWLFWLNEVGFMIKSFNFENRIVSSNILTYTHDSGYQLCVLKLRKWISIKNRVFKGAIDEKLVK